MDPLADSLHLGGDRPDAFLLLHGWTGSPAHFRPAARFLHERGYAVSVPRLAGHGTSVHDMADTGWRDWVRSALDGFYGLAAGYARVHVAGLSMGGVISLLLAATCDVASVTTINARSTCTTGGPISPGSCGEATGSGAATPIHPRRRI